MHADTELCGGLQLPVDRVFCRRREDVVHIAGRGTAGFQKICQRTEGSRAHRTFVEIGEARIKQLQCVHQAAFKGMRQIPHDGMRAVLVNVYHAGDHDPARRAVFPRLRGKRQILPELHDPVPLDQNVRVLQDPFRGIHGDNIMYPE